MNSQERYVLTLLDRVRDMELEIAGLRKALTLVGTGEPDPEPVPLRTEIGSYGPLTFSSSSSQSLTTTAEWTGYDLLGFEVHRKNTATPPVQETNLWQCLIDPLMIPAGPAAAAQNPRSSTHEAKYMAAMMAYDSGYYRPYVGNIDATHLAVTFNTTIYRTYIKLYGYNFAGAGGGGNDHDHSDLPTVRFLSTLPDTGNDKDIVILTGDGADGPKGSVYLHTNSAWAHTGFTLPVELQWGVPL